jgi:hypothetical protein
MSRHLCRGQQCRLPDIAKGAFWDRLKAAVRKNAISVLAVGTFVAEGQRLSLALGFERDDPGFMPATPFSPK